MKKKAKAGIIWNLYIISSENILNTLTNIFSFFRGLIQTETGPYLCKNNQEYLGTAQVWLVEVPDALSVLAFNTFIQTINSGSLFTVTLLKQKNA